MDGAENPSEPHSQQSLTSLSKPSNKQQRNHQSLQKLSQPPKSRRTIEAKRSS
jgi:hypothetical protein